MHAEAISTTRRRTWTRSDAAGTRERVLLLFAAGLKPREVATRLGVDPRTVYRALAWYRERHGLGPGGVGPVGSG